MKYLYLFPQECHRVHGGNGILCDPFRLVDLGAGLSFWLLLARNMLPQGVVCPGGGIISCRTPSTVWRYRTEACVGWLALPLEVLAPATHVLNNSVRQQGHERRYLWLSVYLKEEATVRYRSHGMRGERKG